MALDPNIKIEQLDLKWIKGTCALCRTQCEPEAYLHSACAIARHEYIDAQRKKFWEEWMAAQKEKKK